MRTRALLLCASLAAASGCIEKIAIPECTPVSFSSSSVSGDTVTTTTGLRYIEGTAGSGLSVDWCRNVAVHFDGFLLDGTKVDSSRDGGVPLLFAPGLGGLIAGFEQGVIGLRVGSTRRLIIPPELGFGAEPRTNASGEVIVPGNSTLVYDIEILLVGQAGR
jgi:FKBP-type peptidyl-prolyl cis-trans isomerase